MGHRGRQHAERDQKPLLYLVVRLDASSSLRHPIVCYSGMVPLGGAHPQRFRLVFLSTWSGPYGAELLHSRRSAPGWPFCEAARATTHLARRPSMYVMMNIGRIASCVLCVWLRLCSGQAEYLSRSVVILSDQLRSLDPCVGLLRRLEEPRPTRCAPAAQLALLRGVP